MAIVKASPLFGKINVYDPKGGKQRVEIYIRLQQQVEGMQVGIAVDGSVSMMALYAAHIPPLLRPPGANVMEPVVRHLCRFMCNYSGDGTVLLIYWAVGPGGKEIELLGKMNTATSETMAVDGPKRWGSGTCLLPAFNHFLTEFATAKWAVVLFITDGVVEDEDPVIARSLEVGHEIVNGKRGNCKFVVVGIGEADQEQLDRLDNMFDGTDLEGKVDLWDCKPASDMTDLQEIWDDMTDLQEISIPGTAKITDDQGNAVQSYGDGIPQRMEFEVKAGTKSVTVDIAGQKIIQPLSE